LFCDVVESKKLIQVFNFYANIKFINNSK